MNADEIKDKILEIMQKTDKVNENKHYLPPDKRQKISAKLIADMVKAFTEWQVCSQRFLPTIDRDIDDSVIEYFFMDYDSRDLKKYTLDELFDYWHKNIYNIKDKEI